MAEDALHEGALRALPLPYSLALRLRTAGVASDAICEYVGIEVTALDAFYRMAEAKLESELSRRVASAARFE